MSASAAAASQLEQELIAADFAGLDGCALIEKVLADPRLGRVALVSSFGTESAVLLALVAEVAPATPVVFLDTLRHFGETLRYRDRLVAQLGLEDVRSVRPDPAEIARRDPDLLLFQRDPDACCALRKVEPLERALSGFGGWITGRKRFQALTRADLPAVEWAADEGRFKINPLAGWSPDRVAAEFEAPRSAPPSAGGRRLPVDRLHALYRAGRAGRRPALRPLVWPRQDRMRYPPHRRSLPSHVPLGHESSRRTRSGEHHHPPRGLRPYRSAGPAVVHRQGLHPDPVAAAQGVLRPRPVPADPARDPYGAAGGLRVPRLAGARLEPAADHRGLPAGGGHGPDPGGRRPGRRRARPRG